MSVPDDSTHDLLWSLDRWELSSGTCHCFWWSGRKSDPHSIADYHTLVAMLRDRFGAEIVQELHGPYGSYLTIQVCGMRIGLSLDYDELFIHAKSAEDEEETAQLAETLLGELNNLGAQRARAAI